MHRMRLYDLPDDILINILQFLEHDKLSCLLDAIERVPLVPLSFKCLVQSVLVSRNIVTNRWHNELHLLPRALQVHSVEVLSRFCHHDFFETEPAFWNSLTSSSLEFNVLREISVIIGILKEENTALEELEAFKRFLGRLPPALHPLVKQFHFYVEDEVKANPNLELMVYDILRTNSALFSNILRLKLDGTGYASAPSCDKLDFSSFTMLRTLQIHNWNIKNISDLSLPLGLITLDLSYNAINNWTYFEFPELLKSLDLSNNSLQGLLEGNWPLALLSLNLNNNSLELIVGLSNSIIELNISHNRVPKDITPMPGSLQVFRTDLLQLHLLPAELRTQLELKGVVVICSPYKRRSSVTRQPAKTGVLRVHVL